MYIRSRMQARDAARHASSSSFQEMDDLSQSMQRNLIANAKNNYISNRLRLAPSSARLWSELHSLDLANFKTIDLKPEISLDQLNLFFTSFHFLASLLLHSPHSQLCDSFYVPSCSFCFSFFHLLLFLYWRTWYLLLSPHHATWFNTVLRKCSSDRPDSINLRLILLSVIFHNILDIFNCSFNSSIFPIGKQSM